MRCFLKLVKPEQKRDLRQGCEAISYGFVGASTKTDTGHGW